MLYMFFPEKRHLRLGRLLARNVLKAPMPHNADGFAGPPVNIHIQPTLACNLACKMCIQNGPAGYLKPGDDLVKSRLDVDKWEKFLREAGKRGPFVHIWGGEPLLYREIDSLVNVVRKLDLPVMITTNALRGADHIETLMKIDVLRISIDGPADVHDEVRGKPGSFGRAIDLIKTVAAERKKRRSHSPRIVTNSLVVDTTYQRLEETVGILADLPIDRCDLSLPMFTTKERGEAYANILKKEYGVEAKAWKGFMIEGLTVDIDKLIASLEKIRETRSRKKFSLFPIGRISGVRDWYEKMDEKFGFDHCAAVWDNLNVLPNGDVVLCNDLPDLVVGNMAKQSFDEVWNGETARSFRRRLLKGSLPVCSRCCLLYVFPIWKAAAQQRWLR